MITKLIIFLIAVFSCSAQADILKCVFTEPFLTVQYSMTQSRIMQIQHVGENKPETTFQNNISFQIFDAGEFELWDRDRKVVMELLLNHNGSDGMSDRNYPYSAKYNHPTFGSLTGGCTSNFLHAQKVHTTPH